MGRGRRLKSIEDFNRSLRGKYGLGQGESYKPWLRIHDVSSSGVKSEVWGRKTFRNHHFLSSLESEFFYLAEFSDSVVDIREQFPLLPLNLSQKIAKTIGVKHPTVPSTGGPNIMTTDFLLTCQSQNQTFYRAISVKPAEKVNKRTAEKLDIERIWWELLGVQFSLFTGSELTKVQSRNIRWATAPFRSKAVDNCANKTEEVLNVLSEGPHFLSELCEKIGSVTKYNPGGLDMLRYLIAHKLILVDLSSPIDTTGKLLILTVNYQRGLAASGDS